MRIAASSVALLCLIALACDNESTDAFAANRSKRGATSSEASDKTGRYPQDITPPAGTQYPCALTALPRNLPGIPEADRQYINRTYARILRATQAKLILLKALEERRAVDAALSQYERSAVILLNALNAEVAPSGLESFHRDVVQAVELQLRFFRKAVPLHHAGKSASDLFALSEAHEASQRLIAAWGAMASRYPAWSEATKDSIYHHLCALDFF